ncbi:MAG: class I SAM-dependent methyltransferase [Chloroflexota bacterium]
MAADVPLYDRFSESYDVMVNWEERLEREEPFFRELFRRAAARRVLDVGCATGGHVLRFADMGLEAVGVDPSLEMVRRAEARADGRPGVRFAQAGFGELVERVGGSFDAVTCLGNTLPHATTRPELDRALVDMAAVLRPGGLLAIQQLNYDRILVERRRFLGVSSGVRGGVEQLFFRFYDFDGLQLTFNVVTFKKEAGRWGFQAGSTRLRAIRQAELAEALEGAGFGPVEWHGGYDRSGFDPSSSSDLVVVAERR